MAELEDLGAGGVGLEEGVIEDGGEVLWGCEGVGGEGCGVEVLWSVGKRVGDSEGAQKRTPSATVYPRRVLSIIPGYELVE